MKRALLGTCAVTVMTALSGVVGASAQAATLDTSMCTNPTLSQAFLPWGDTNEYTPVAGMSATGFNPTGWTLSGGASVVTTTLPNGTNGTVLDLPSGASAQSPISCVGAAYPVARGWVDRLTGSGGVGLYVSYELTRGWQSPKLQGTLSASSSVWALPSAISIMPTGAAGWQPVKITLVGTGTGSHSQVSDLELDPRFSH